MMHTLVTNDILLVYVSHTDRLIKYHIKDEHRSQTHRRHTKRVKCLQCVTKEIKVAYGYFSVKI